MVQSQNICFFLPNYRKLKHTHGSLKFHGSFLMDPRLTLFFSPSFTRANVIHTFNPPSHHNGSAHGSEGTASLCSLHLSAFPAQGSHHLDSQSCQFCLSFIYILYPHFILSKCFPAPLTCCKSPAYGGTFLMNIANERWPSHQF